MASDPLVWHKVAGLSGAAALACGTYGAHMFKPKNEVYKEVWRTANVYHLAHTAALLAVPLTKRPNLFGGLLTFGIVAFSGSGWRVARVQACYLQCRPGLLTVLRCYTTAILEDRKWSSLAPFGGLAFIAAWASLVF